MARTESRTKTAIWSDDEFRKLTGRSQRMYWLLFSQSTISLCGVIALTERRWATTACDETIETVRNALTELEENRYILVDWDTEEILVRTFARHDGIARNSKTFAPAWQQLANISSQHLRAEAEAQLSTLGKRPPDTPSPPDKPDKHGVSAGRDHEENGVSDTPSDTPFPRARRSVPSLRPLSPSSSPPDPGIGHSPPSPPGDETAGLGAPHWDGDEAIAVQLAQRLAAICTGGNRQTVNTEALQVVVWALKHVDPRIVDEALGWARTKPPTLPRAVASVIQSKAGDHGIRLPDFGLLRVVS